VTGAGPVLANPSAAARREAERASSEDSASTTSFNPVQAKELPHREPAGDRPVPRRSNRCSSHTDALHGMSRHAAAV